MMYHDKLYAVKNDRGEFAYIEMDELTWETGFATVWLSLNKPYAERTSSDYGGHVVELVEAPAKIVVSEEEEEILDMAKSDGFGPARTINAFSSDHGGWKTGSDLEDRLMRAYVIGWTVEKPKRYLVRVPHANRHYYYQKCDSGEVIPVWDMETEPPTQFTEAEIIEYGLQDCEKEEVTNDEQQNNQARKPIFDGPR